MNNFIDLIVILGGGLKKDKNGWRTARPDEHGDDFSVRGDHMRVDAAYFLYKKFFLKNSNLLLLSSGERGQLKRLTDSPTIASVIKKELLALGITEERILLEENSNNTFQQLEEILKIIFKKNFKSIVVISNQW